MLPQSIQNLINQFSKLPSVGPRTAARYVFWLVKQPSVDIEKFGEAIKNLKNDLKTCKNCFNYSNESLCLICASSTRNNSIICVVEEPLNIIPIEKTGKYQGLYHVLGGTLNPPHGIKPENLRIQELISRLKDGLVKEIIIGLSPTTYGDTTGLHLMNALKPFNIKITRLARGLPTGADLEYADETTLSQALDHRTEF